MGDRPGTLHTVSSRGEGNGVELVGATGFEVVEGKIVLSCISRCIMNISEM